MNESAEKLADGLSLYHLADWTSRLQYALLDAEGEMVPEIAEVLEAELAEVGAALDEKLVRCGQVVLTLQANAAAAKMERDRLDSIYKRWNRSGDSLKEYMRNHMTRVGVGKVKHETCPLRLQKNPASVVVECEATDLPTEFQKIQIDPDNTALKAAWKAGDKLPAGVSIDETRNHIRIG